MEVDAFSAPDTAILFILAAGTELAAGGIRSQRGCGMHYDFICTIECRFEEVQTNRVAGVHGSLVKCVDAAKTWKRKIREVTGNAIPLLKTPKLSPGGSCRKAVRDTIHDVQGALWETAGRADIEANLNRPALDTNGWKVTFDGVSWREPYCDQVSHRLNHRKRHSHDVQINNVEEHRYDEQESKCQCHDK